jgi:MFS family permease
VAPISGKAADVWGRKPALLSSIALFAVGSAICGWSQTVEQLIAGRAVQGTAAGGIIVLVNISISDLWDAR